MSIVLKCTMYLSHFVSFLQTTRMIYINGNGLFMKCKKREEFPLCNERIYQRTQETHTVFTENRSLKIHEGNVFVQKSL